MGDKGKKAKDKGLKQKATRHDKEARTKIERQPQKTS
jgi:hypothetical protein